MYTRTVAVREVSSSCAFALALLLASCGGTSDSGGGGGTATYTIGGTISGLSGTVVLQDNGGDSLALLANGGFTFARAVADTSTYAVSVLAQPPGETCSVSNGAGTVSGANVANVSVICAVNAYGVVERSRGSRVAWCCRTTAATTLRSQQMASSLS